MVPQSERLVAWGFHGLTDPGIDRRWPLFLASCHWQTNATLRITAQRPEGLAVGHRIHERE